MTKETILNLLEDFIITTIPENAEGKWLKAELHVWVQPNFMQVHGSYFTKTEELQLEMKKGRAVRKNTLSLLQEFHKITANKGQTNWNSGQFTLIPNGTLEHNLYWDQARQHEADTMNRESAREAGVDYMEPVWNWD
jgi:hypothetical protein